MLHSRERIPPGNACSAPSRAARSAVVVIAWVLVRTSAAHADDTNDGSRPIVTWTADPNDGFSLLRMEYTPEFKVGSTQIIEEDKAWAKAWDYFQFRGTRPAVDFEHRQMVLFVVADHCAGGGPAPDAVVAVHLFEDGALVPEFPPAEDYVCPMALLRQPEVRGYAYVLTVPRISRQGAPAPREVALHRALPRVRGTARRTPPCALDSGRHVSPPPSTTAAHVPLPLRRRAALITLEDGTPVWVVRHDDDTVSVLGGEFEMAADWVPGLFAAAGFCQHNQQFSGDFDAWGTHLSGARPGLIRYEAQVAQGHLTIGASAGPAPPGKVRLQAPEFSNAQADAVPPNAGAPMGLSHAEAAQASDPDARHFPTLIGPFDHLSPKSLCEAMRAPVGSLSRVDGVLRLRPRRHPILESAEKPSSECAGATAPVLDVEVPFDCYGDVVGQFAVRRDESGLRHLVVLVVWEGDLECRTREGMRGRWAPHAGWGAEKQSYQAAASGYSGWNGSHLLAGAEFGVTYRYRFEGWPPAPPTFLQRLGDTVDFSVRGRLLHEVGATESAPEGMGWMLGGAIALSRISIFEHWVGPSLLGMALPEIGVARRAALGSYLGWRLPIEYRFYAGTERQHAYSLWESTGLELTPSFFLLFNTHERTNWNLGLSAGMFAW